MIRANRRIVLVVYVFVCTPLSVNWMVYDEYSSIACTICVYSRI
jgi:hypothetical protein